MLKYVKVYLLTALSVFFPLFAERLVLFPAVERIFFHSGSADGFGYWTWAYGLFLLVGLGVAQGSNYIVLRFYSGFAFEFKRQLIKLAVGRCVYIGIPALSLCMGYVVFSEDYERIKALLPFVFFVFILSLYQTFSLSYTALFRVIGRFDRMLAAAVFPYAIILFACLYIYLAEFDYDKSTVCLIIAALGVAFLGAVLNLRAKSDAVVHNEKNPRLSNEIPFDKKFLKKEALLASLISVGDHGVNYIPRLALGLTGDMVGVGGFVATMSMASMLFAPVTLAGNVAMSILSSKERSFMTRKRRNQYYGIVCLVSIVMASVTFFALPYLVKIFYPRMEAAAVDSLIPFSMAAFSLSVVTLIRPVVMKWVGVYKVVWHSAILFLIAAGVSYFASSFGVLGAAWAYASMVSVLMMIWVVASRKLGC